MSTPQYCPGCGNRCSLDSPSCSTGEAYLRALRQAKKKQRAAPATDTPASQPAPQTQAPQKPAQSSEVSPAPAAQTTRKAAGAAPRKRPTAARSSGSRGPGKASTPRPAPAAPAEIYASLSREDKLSFQLRSLSRHLAQNQPREKSGQGRILALLAQRGELPQRELVALAGIRSSSLSELLGKLEGAGLVVRSACPTDRRTTLVTLTEQGRRQAAQSRTGTQADPFRPLSTEEQLQLLSLLEKLNGETP